MKYRKRVDIFADGSVAIVRDLEGEATIDVYQDDIITPVQSVDIDEGEYNKLREAKHDEIWLNKDKKTFVISHNKLDDKKREMSN